MTVKKYGVYHSKIKIKVKYQMVTYVVILKTIGRKWFLFLVLVIVIVAFIHQVAAIWMAGITAVLILLSYVPNLFFKNRLHRFMKKYYMIEDELIARKFEKPVKKIRDKMFELSQGQEKKKWLIVFLNKQYIIIIQREEKNLCEK